MTGFDFIASFSSLSSPATTPEVGNGGSKRNRFILADLEYPVALTAKPAKIYHGFFLGEHGPSPVHAFGGGMNTHL